MKKILLGITLLLGGVFCFSCGGNKIANIEQEEIVIREDETEEVNEPIIEQNESNNTESAYISKYCDFLDNFLETGPIYNTVSLSSTSYIEVSDVKYGIEATNISSSASGVVLTFTYNTDKTFSIAVAGQEWDITAAILESFIMRDYSSNPARVYYCNFEVSDDAISCTGSLVGSKEIKTCMSYNSDGYLTSYKGLSFNYSSAEDSSTFITCNLELTWAK